MTPPPHNIKVSNSRKQTPGSFQAVLEGQKTKEAEWPTFFEHRYQVVPRLTLHHKQVLYVEASVLGPANLEVLAMIRV